MKARAWVCAAWIGLVGCKGGDDELPPAVAIDPEALELGDVAVGTSGVGTFSVTNTGDGTLHVLSVSRSSGDADAWAIAEGDGRDLGRHDSLVVTVTFTPQEEGPSFAEVLVRTDDENLTVPLTGNGTPSTTDYDGDGFSVAAGDCNDGDGSVFPGAPEGCNGRDNDCNGQPAANESDDDGDGVRICELDCDDDDANVAPGNPEICDDKDDDCDGVNRDRVDGDGDGFAICDGDCDDSTPQALPGGTEVCDGFDNDCNGVVDIDEDGDGHSPCTEAGDCDDQDASAHPIVVDATASANRADGTDAHPYVGIEDAEPQIEPVCHTIWLAPGTYDSDVDPGNGPFDVTGAAAGGVVLVPIDTRHIFDVTNGAVLTLRRVTVAQGAVGNDGGAIRVDASTLVALDVTFDSNSAPNEGGAINARNGSHLDLQRCVFTNNSAGSYGGAIAATDSLVTVDDSLFGNNSSQTRGGAIAAAASTVTLERNKFWRGQAVEDGGALALDGITGGVLRNNRFQDSSADRGGGVSITGGAAAFELVNNTFAGCTATNDGAGIDVSASDTSGLYVAGDIVAGCTGVSGLHAPASALVEYNTVFGTSSGLDFDGPTASTNETTDPQFTNYSANGDPSDDDLMPRAGSPVIDNGPSDPAYDDRDGTRNDRGFSGGPAAP